MMVTSKTKLPPLGAPPKFVRDGLRISELKEAIIRFLQSNWPIPEEFVTEYNQLAEALPIESDKEEEK